jgi:lipoprotein-anchoring transpeptidase ErfK/SrfK
MFKSICVVFGLCLAGVAMSVPAQAQWRYYQGYQAYPAYPGYPPQGYYPDNGYDPDDEPPPPPHRRRASTSPAYPDDYGQAPVQTRRGVASVPDAGPADVGQQEATAASSPRTATIVRNPTGQPAGTIVVDTRTRHLYLVTADGQAIQYGIGVGRQGFAWKGEAHVERKSEWPAWYPPSDMLKRRPDLPDHMEGGIDNPLGARALYLYQGNKDTLFRIHGTNEPDSIGKAMSSGCIRMMNADVMDLYNRVPIGTHVVVL